MSTQPTDLLARLAALYKTVALNPGMVEASGGHKWREMIEISMELTRRVDTNIMITEMISVDVARLTARLDILDDSFRRADVYFKSMAETISALRQEYADLKAQVAALEAWKEQTGDGK